MSTTFRRLWFCCVPLALWAAGPVGAADPAPVEELLRFVPADMTYCLVVRDLRKHASALADSPLAAALKRSPLGLLLRASPEMRKVARASAFFEKYLKITPTQLRDDILGDAVVFAYRVGPPGKPEQEQGMLLIRARQPKLLAALVERLNAIQKESKDLKAVEERVHEGAKYYRRVERKQNNFYYLRGSLLVFSGQEALLRRAIVQERKAKTGQESPVGQQLRLLGADRALAAVLLNPRGFDAVLEAKLARAKGAEAAFLKTFVACWKGIEGAAFTLKLSSDLEAGLAVRAKPGTLPQAVRRFLEAAAARSDLWPRFPDDALLAFSARTPPSALLEMLEAFQTKPAIKKLREESNRGLGSALGGKNAVTEVLPYVGPDWGFCVSAPPQSDKRWFPSVVFAVRVSSGDKTAPLDRAALNALNSYALLAVIGHNKTHKDTLSLKTLRENKLEIHYLSSSRGQASGLQPAFGLWGGYLVLASSPDALRRFVTATPASVSTGEVPLLRLSLKDLRRYLAERRQPLTAALAAQHKLKPEAVGPRLDGIRAVLHFFDRLELTQKTAAGQVTLTLRLRTSLPLRK